MTPVPLLLLCCALSGGFAVPVRRNETIFLAVPSNGTLLDDGAVLPSIEPRIVGGCFVNEPIPYQISLRAQVTPPDRDPRSLMHFCGGSLISEYHVLTAAHCLGADMNYYLESGRIFAVMGTTLKLFDPTTTFVSMIQVAVVHEKFTSGSTLKNDVAVLKLQDKAPLHLADVGTINLASKLPPVGEKCTVSGWGVEKSGHNEGTKVLKKAEVPIYDKESCKRRYSAYDISDDMLCAGEELGGVDSCQGDSGGPLVCGGELTGVVSWGEVCARPKSPGIYASVPHLSQWVLWAMGRADEISKPINKPKPPLPASGAETTTIDFWCCVFFFCVTVFKISDLLCEAFGMP